MQTALILGASRGIGLELVRQYLANGWRVIATARDDAGLALLKSMGAQTLRVDVANPISVSGLDWMLDGEKLDVAMYVAGVIDHAAIDAAPTQQAFDRVMHTNVMGAMMATSSAVAYRLTPTVKISRTESPDSFADSGWHADAQVNVSVDGHHDSYTQYSNTSSNGTTAHVLVDSRTHVG